MNYVVKTSALTKQFPGKIAANDINMNIEAGDIYGFIGKNGAGKTTTMKMLLGLIQPTSGHIELFGSSKLDKERRRIGSLIEAPGLYKNCTAYENLLRFSILYGGDKKQIQDILELIGLAGTGSRKAGNFSLGMKQRLGIGIALLGGPELLILDEPINGLDPAAIKDVRDCIINLNKEKNVTFLISSHLLDELSKITTRYGIINNGSLVEEISAAELEMRCRRNLVLRTNKPNMAVDLLKSHGLLHRYQLQNNDILLYSDDDNLSPERSSIIVKFLVNNGIDVYEIFANNQGFEDYFIERIGK